MHTVDTLHTISIDGMSKSHVALQEGLSRNTVARVESYRLVSQAASTEASAAFGGAFRLRCLASLH